MTKVDYEELVRLPDSMLKIHKNQPDQIFDSNRIRIARWGNVIAWTDGPRAGVDELDTVDLAKVAFLQAIIDAREDV